MLLFWNFVVHFYYKFAAGQMFSITSGESCPG